MRLMALVAQLSNSNDRPRPIDSAVTAGPSSSKESPVQGGEGTKPKSSNAEASSEAFKYFLPMQTRWSDNDQYSHLNNVQYAHYFDTVVNEFLINHCGMVPHSQTSPIALAVSADTTYLSSISFPSPVLAALSVVKLGKSSVTYRVGLFEATKKTTVESNGISTVRLEPTSRTASAFGHFVHVYVDPKTRRPVEIPAQARQVLEGVMSP